MSQGYLVCRICAEAKLPDEVEWKSNNYGSSVIVCINCVGSRSAAQKEIDQILRPSNVLELIDLD